MHIMDYKDSIYTVLTYTIKLLYLYIAELGVFKQEHFMGIYNFIHFYNRKTLSLWFLTGEHVIIPYLIAVSNSQSLGQHSGKQRSPHLKV